MALTIWKYRLKWVERQGLDLPAGAQVLSVQMQDLKPVLWALVDPHQPVNRPHTISAVFTGELIVVDPGRYISTVQQGYSDLVWHFFIQEGI